MENINVVACNSVADNQRQRIDDGNTAASPDSRVLNSVNKHTVLGETGLLDLNKAYDEN
jgi:hypothetical protein